MQGHKHSKGMSKSKDYETLGQGRWEAGMERGELGRVGHMEFQERNQGSQLKWRIEK